MLCSCGEKAGGAFCETVEDVCQNCYNSSTCQSDKENYCGPCPAGYEGDGKICRGMSLIKAGLGELAVNVIVK